MTKKHLLHIFNLKKPKPPINDALNVFTKPKKPYKPSLLLSVAYGPVTERFKLAPMAADKTEFNTTKLVDILDVISVPKETMEMNHEFLELSDQKFRSRVANISDEKTLLDIVKFLYHHKKLSPSKMTNILMNKHLKNLQLLPFHANNIEKSDISWPEIEYVKFKINLLRKHHNLRQPLNIVKSLQTNRSVFLKSVTEKLITQFHERVFWKFYFEYMKQDEQVMINELDDIYHSFTIWESSRNNNQYISNIILNKHKLTDLQSVFLRICSSDRINQMIDEDYQVLQYLKKISIDHKIWQLGQLDDSIKTRATQYLVIDALEQLLSKTSGEKNILNELKRIKREMTKFKSDEKGSWDDKLVLLSLK